MNFSIDEDDDWWRRGKNPADFDDSVFDDDPELDHDDESTIECSNCGEEIFADAEQCPHCGVWIVPDTSITGGKPSPLIVLGIVAAIIAIGAMLLRR